MKQNTQKKDYGYSNIVYLRKPIAASYQIHSSTCPPNLHFHDCHEIMIITQGKYKLYAPQNVYEGEGPCLVFFHLGTYHGSVRVDCEKLSFQCFVVNYAQSIVDEIPDHMIDTEHLHDNDIHIVPISRETRDFLFPIASELVKLYQEHKFEEGIPFESYGYLTVILNNFARLVREGKAISIDGRKDGDNYIYKVVRRIIEQVAVGKDVSVTAIAEEFFVSGSKLSKDFQKVMGITVKSLVDELVLERIKGMLKKGMSNVDVAAACGFSSESYFIQFFYKHMNVSPGNYRKLHSVQGSRGSN